MRYPIKCRPLAIVGVVNIIDLTKYHLQRKTTLAETKT